jgi:hypothetical protein
MIVRHLNRSNKICFYQFDSPNQSNNRTPYALSNTPLYTPHTDSWQNIRTIRQTELECGMWDASLFDCIIDSSTHRHFADQSKKM